MNLFIYLLKRLKERRDRGREEVGGRESERTADILDTIFVVSTVVPAFGVQALHPNPTRKVGIQQLLEGREELLSGPPHTSHLSFHHWVPPPTYSSPTILHYLLTSEDWLSSQGLSPCCSPSGNPTRRGARVRPRNLPRTLAN